MKSDKKIAVVTGALGGIGTAIVGSFLSDGVVVIATIRLGTLERATDWKKTRFDNNEDLYLLEVDVADYTSCEQLIAQVKEQFGRLDILVNNAGITRDSSIKKMSFEQWNEVLNTNLTGCFNMSKSAFILMLENNYGRIINISSVNGQKGQFGQVNYSASKSGIYGLTKSLALEGARKGITVNSISPGYIRTEMTSKIPPNILDAIISEIPVGRMGEPEEVADTVRFLASEKSAFITGSNLAMNGGQHLY
ncbi:acetoacetyl-CoA reductase [Pseudoalteromonas sp. S16_S37]|uniref:acetoacetyl-CoA reductase n=1 Tax=Pseudoalteromonas sp. S16_S37 TaxID=2720228 RepID=UPI00168025BC|nr:acetoacetyl-CoA reductase [Pseudoalteromonas sp. S16_S37]MBD1580943.1 acetoacetyl-CoA reductase [Pseudoalteromonas sp. S16_S37]